MLRRLLDVPAEAELVSYSDPGKECFRYAAIAGGRLLACAFFGPPDRTFPVSSWPQCLLGRDISVLDRIALLAGLDARCSNTGKTVCACFAVSEDSICAAIRGQGLTTRLPDRLALQPAPIAAPAFPNSRSCSRRAAARPGGVMAGPDGTYDTGSGKPGTRPLCQNAGGGRRAAIRCPLVQIADPSDTQKQKLGLGALSNRLSIMRFC